MMKLFAFFLLALYLCNQVQSDFEAQIKELNAKVDDLRNELTNETTRLSNKLDHLTQDCIWANWGEWGKCSSTCGHSIKTRTRSKEVKEYGFGSCIGGPSMTNACKTTPCQCFNYKNLTESWRKIRKIDSSGSHHSDKWGYWDGWYRFGEPAGTKLANKDIGYEACDTNSASGWLDGPDPTEVGKTIQERICFSGYSKYMTDVLRPCAHVEWIHVTLCKDSNDEKFLVYQLKGPPEYASVYCAE